MAPVEQKPTRSYNTTSAPEAVHEEESERRPPSSHSRGMANAVSFVEATPIFPRSFASPSPFSPPASIISFSSMADVSPSPSSGLTSKATSIADFSRLSGHYASPPSLALEQAPGANGNRSSTRSRETFTSPPIRPLTMHSMTPSSKVARERPKSTLLAAPDALHKPWVGTRDPYSRVAYLLTYAVLFIGIAAGAVRAYLAWHSVPLLTGNLCLVMDENFDSDQGVFGENGTFFREVDMSGLG